MMPLTVQQRASNVIVNLCMTALWAMFAVRHVGAFNETGAIGFLVICLSEAITAVFFLFRTRAVSVSSSRLDWLLAIVGTFAPLFFQPSDVGILPWASTLILPGVVLQILGVLSLNRSFGLVAAQREIKTSGMYRVVRHPLYASYLIILMAYAASNTTPGNVVILTVTFACLTGRILREESHLAADPMYQRYMQQVRYRVVPLLF